MPPDHFEPGNATSDNSSSTSSGLLERIKAGESEAWRRRRRQASDSPALIRSSRPLDVELELSDVAFPGSKWSGGMGNPATGANVKTRSIFRHGAQSNSTVEIQTGPFKYAKC